MLCKVTLDVIPILTSDHPHSLKVFGQTWFESVLVQALEREERQRNALIGRQSILFCMRQFNFHNVPTKFHSNWMGTVSERSESGSIPCHHINVGDMGRKI